MFVLAQSSESLAGRISYMELGGFSLDILPDDAAQRLWIRGGFPKSYLAGSAAASFQWRQDFITTFLERDIPNLGIRIPAPPGKASRWNKPFSMWACRSRRSSSGACTRARHSIADQIHACCRGGLGKQVSVVPIQRLDLVKLS